jgi:hypothetical protein
MDIKTGSGRGGLNDERDVICWTCLFCMVWIVLASINEAMLIVMASLSVLAVLVWIVWRGKWD